MAGFRAAHRLRPGDPYASMLGVARTHMFLKRLEAAAHAVDKVLHLIDEERRALLPVVMSEDCTTAVAIAAAGEPEGKDVAAAAMRRLGALDAHVDAATTLSHVIRRFGHHGVPFEPVPDPTKTAAASVKEEETKVHCKQALPVGDDDAGAGSGDEQDDDDTG